MTRHCLDTGAPFGVVLIRDGREVGAAGRSRWPASARSPRSARPGATPTAATTCWPPATGRFAIESVDAGREPYLVADVTPLDDEVGDEPRAERLAASAIRRFVRYLELMRARDGETVEALDIRVEVESVGADGDDDGDETVTVEEIESRSTSIRRLADDGPARSRSRR